MRLVSVVIAVLVLSGCFLSDTVTDRYSTLADARADQLFERGWLPDILPPSTRDIRTSNNLDLNYSTGEFQYEPGNAGAFFRVLMPGAPKDSPFEGWQNTVRDYAEDGFAGWSFVDTDTTWVFFCHAAKGQCDYFAWLTNRG